MRKRIVQRGCTCYPHTSSRNQFGHGIRTRPLLPPQLLFLHSCIADVQGWQDKYRTPGPNRRINKGAIEGPQHLPHKPLLMQYGPKAESRVLTGRWMFRGPHARLVTVRSSLRDMMCKGWHAGPQTVRGDVQDDGQ